MTRREQAGVRIGIDLGTTHSLAAVLMHGQAIIIPSLLGERLTPSAVSVDREGRTLVGAAAKTREVTHPGETVCNFKRDMGTERTWMLDGKPMRPGSLSALVLAHLRQSGEEHLGRRVLEAVVTVPTYFGEGQRRATQAACEIAGPHVERIINEPTAAALAYGFGNAQSEAKLVVLDLGGETFDVSVLEVADGVVEILASAGDARLGGEDFDELMMEHCGKKTLDTQGVDLSSAADLTAKLRVGCEREERALSSVERASVVVAAVGPSAKTFTLEVTREQTHLQSLKFHPREALPNVAALERAEALFTTLTRDDRALLGELIWPFKSCLETQEPTLIREQREQLLVIIERLQQH